jgi:outer membrane protein assembly factor BamB
MTRRRNIAAALVVVTCLFAAIANAENWPQWRGPNLNGSTSETNLPHNLDPKAAAWTLDMPGPGAGTPIVYGDHVFVNAVDAKEKMLLGMAMDRKTGKVLWSKECGPGFRASRNSDMTSPSAVTDGKTVIFYFGTGDLACFDFQGNQKWARNIEQDHGRFNMQWLYGSSPLLYKGKLYVQVLHRNLPPQRWDEPKQGESLADSYLLIVDPATGKDLHKVIRPTAAKAESQESYATPIPYEGKQRTEIIVIGGDAVTGHDPETGSELWRGTGWNPQFIGHWRLVPSVVIANDLVIACAPKNGPVMAWKPGGSGEVTKTHLAWQTTETTSDVCVPLYYNNKLYVLNGDGRKSLSLVDAATGKITWTQPLESRAVFRASPTGADGKIYCMNEAGQTWVLSASQPKIISQSDLKSEKPSRASIAASQGALFVRTSEKLYCFGGK